MDNILARAKKVAEAAEVFRLSSEETLQALEKRTALNSSNTSCACWTRKRFSMTTSLISAVTENSSTPTWPPNYGLT